MRKEVRVIGIDDGPFAEHKDKTVLVVGAIFRGGRWLDDVVSTRVRVNGTDSTQKIARMVRQSKFFSHFKALFLHGVAVGGFNIIDTTRLHKLIRLPVIIVNREKPDFEEIYSEIDKHKFSRRKKLIIKLPAPEKVGKLYVQCIGITLNGAKALLRIVCTRSIIPETLRAAHFIAGGILKCSKCTKGRKNSTKFLILGDLHGKLPKIHFKDYDAIIAPGDFCSDEARKYMFQAMKLRDQGRNVRWSDLVGKKKAMALVRHSLAQGRKVLRHLNNLGKPVYVVPGNCDWTSGVYEWDWPKKNFYSELIRGLGNIFDVHHKLLDVEGYQIVGHGITSGPEYPQHREVLNGLTRKELKIRKAIYKEQLGLVSGLIEGANKPVILLLHNVPFKTKLDKINNEASPRNGRHYGSIIARKVIEQHQPLVAVGGHMHEHFNIDKIKRTVCINAGYGSKVNVLLELKKGRIKSAKFWPKKYG